MTLDNFVGSVRMESNQVPSIGTEGIRKRNHGFNRLTNDEEKVPSLNIQTKKEDKSHKRDFVIAFVLTLWASYIRLYKISQPPSVV